MGGAKTKTTCFRVNVLCRRTKGYFEPCKATLVEFWDQNMVSYSYLNLISYPINQLKLIMGTSKKGAG